MTKGRCVSVILVVVAAFIGCNDQPNSLPFLGIHSTDSTTGDTLYFTVPKFSLVNQNGEETSFKDYAGKPYVADFFFTTCPSICPIMSSQMVRLQALVDDKGWADQMAFLSHTIDPEKDSAEVLLEYANKIGANLGNWNFVTGERSDIYYLAKDGYMVNALQSDTAAGGYIHSDSFVLVDGNSHIRGYYDGTSTKEVDKLLEDLETLMHEHTRQ